METFVAFGIRFWCWYWLELFQLVAPLLLVVDYRTKISVVLRDSYNILIRIELSASILLMVSWRSANWFDLCLGVH